MVSSILFIVRRGETIIIISKDTESNSVTPGRNQQTDGGGPSRKAIRTLYSPRWIDIRDQTLTQEFILTIFTARIERGDYFYFFDII